MMNPVIISGLYPYTKNGVTHYPTKTLQEISLSLKYNPACQKEVLVLAADNTYAELLESMGVKVFRTFEDAPKEIWENTAHKMKF